MRTCLDLTVFDDAAGESIVVPDKLNRALEIIAMHLHPRIQMEGMLSRTQCVLCSLTVRDFLIDIGFRDAHALSCMLIIKAFKHEAIDHSFGLGVKHDGHAVPPGKWAGHLAVVLPKAGWLIDPTTYQAMRAQWPMVSGMSAVPLLVPKIPKRQKIVAGFGYASTAGVPRRVSAAWWSSPLNRLWQSAPDSIAQRRAPVVDHLVRTFEHAERRE